METIQGIYPACSVNRSIILWNCYSYTEKKIMHMGEK